MPMGCARLPRGCSGLARRLRLFTGHWSATRYARDGVRLLSIPRHNPVNAFTMGGIIRDAGLTIEQFKEFL